MLAVSRGSATSARETLQQRHAWANLHAIVASNRGPLEFRLDDDGSIRATPSSGGVVTALSGFARYMPFTWIATAATEADRIIACQTKEGTAVEQATVRFVLLSPDVYHRHYNLFSNPLLWFVQHSLASRLRPETVSAALSRGWTEGYVPANRAFAQSIASVARSDGRRPVIMLHDYHLYLAAGYLRRMLPGALLQHFIHIPWPSPSEWLVLPAARRNALLRSLLNNDIVGFQTERCAAQFLRCCEAFLPDACLDRRRREVDLEGHTTQIRVYPISIDLVELRAALSSPEVLDYQRKLRPARGLRTIVRVDRLDPSKDVANGFRAFARLLEDEPHWQGRLRFLAFLVPSRSNIPEYQCYAYETFQVARMVNERFGRPCYQPIQIFHENNRPQALVGLKDYDVLLVNSLADGMNLVAKEGVVANERDGVLVLSTAAGVYEQLRRGALAVMPGDVAGIAAALSRALAMNPEERRRRATLLREMVEQYDVADWATEQLDDLVSLLSPPVRRWA